MSKLSLTTRKNIKDSEPKLQENLKKLTTHTGITFETEFDWTVIAPVCEERGYKDRCGEVVYDWYLSGLVSNVESFVKDSIQKESFIETFGTKKLIQMEIVDAVDEDSPHRSDYNWVENKDGVLLIKVPKERFCSNVSYLGSNLSQACSGDSPLSVATRKNIADTQKTLQGHLKTIKTASGVEFELEVDWVALAAVAKDRGYEDRVGEIIYDWYLGGLASNVKSFCGDAIQKEAFIEAFGTKHSIQFVLEGELDDDSPHRSDYNWIVNNGGVLEVHFTKERFCSNVSYLGNDLSKACSGDSPLSVATRKNIKDEEPKLKKNLARIQKATGIEFEVEVDWAQWAEIAKERGYEDRVGEIIYDWYLSGLAGNLESLCKDDMCKEAVGEACGKKTIAFVLKDQSELESDYVRCTFSDDGVLQINLSRERFCSNVSYTGNDIESRL